MRFLVRTAAVAALTLGLASAPDVARAQVDSREGIALQNQIAQLRQELQYVRDQVARGGGGGGGGAAPRSGGGNDMVPQLLTRIDALDDQIRQLRGRIDELQNQNDRQHAEMSKRIDDLAFQMNDKPAQPIGGGAAPPPQQQPSQPPQPRTRTPEIAMQEGNAALARRDYAGAEHAAREVLATKGSPRQYDGQYLLGQSLYGQKQYSNAAIAYDDAYKYSPKGIHAQDALLGLANALVAIGEKNAACGTIRKLRNEFPQPRPEVRDGAAATAQKAGCG